MSVASGKHRLLSCRVFLTELAIRTLRETVCWNLLLTLVRRRWTQEQWLSHL
ncbi:MAG: hypothetical protein U0401_31605 [Anaerolineae bacterium]